MSYKFQTGPAALSGAIAPAADGAFDLGASGLEWKDLYVDGTANIDSLVADTADINGGNIDATVIGATSAVAGTFAALVGTSLSVSDGNITNVGDIALDSISGDNGSSFSMGTNWTNASRTVADMGIVTTMDLNGGTIDGTVIGATGVAAGSFAAVVGTTGTYSAGLTCTTMSASSTLQVGGATTLAALTAAGAAEFGSTIKPTGVAAVGIAVADDSMFFLDADGLMKKTTQVLYAAALVASEPGFASSSGKLQYDPNSLSAGAIASGDSLSFVDSNDSNIPKKDTVDDLATLFAGVGLSAASAVLALDLNELGAATVDVASDSIAIVDSNDSNATKKESIADLVAAMAGTGITASAGTLNVSSASAPAAVGNENATLTEAFNYASAEITGTKTWTLPASGAMSAGDTVYVKVSTMAVGALLKVAANTSQTIDGLTELQITEEYASISLKYVATNTWRIF